MCLQNRLFPIQVRVRASDNGVPPKSNTNLVTVQVDRNLQAPSFQVTTYRKTIKEIFPVGDVLLNVTATDVDSQVGIIIAILYRFCSS